MSINQSAKNSIKYFLKTSVDLKVYFDIITQPIAAPLSYGKIEAGVRMILFQGPHLLLRGPYYKPLMWYIMHKKLQLLY